jgi:hypothetical protein
MAKQYNFEKIRALLTEGFSDEELRHLCFDVPVFRPVYSQLAKSTGKAEIVQQLLEYVEQKELIETLLDQAKERNPAKYEKYQSYYEVTPRSKDLYGIGDAISKQRASFRDDFKEKSSKVTINEGIQANNVTADILAVGRGAKAIKIVRSAAEAHELIKAIRELQQGLDELNLNPTAREVVEEDITELENIVILKHPDPEEIERLLKSMANKLKMVGVILAEVIALSTPISKIVKILGLSLKVMRPG